MLKEQATCLSQLFSFHVVGKTKTHVLVFSDPLILLSLYPAKHIKNS